MDYLLTSCLGRGEVKTLNPTLEMIEQIIDNLLPVQNYFMILKSEKPVQNCSFVQTLIPEEDDTTEILFLVEANFRHKGDKIFRMFTTDSAKVKGIFVQYLSGIMPDVTGWEDVTEKVFPKKRSRNKKST